MYVCMTHQIDVLSAQKCSCLSRCVRARIVVVKSDPSFAVGFPDFLEDNWQTNVCVPLFCVVLVVRLQHVQFFRKKTGHHLLGSASCPNNFCSIWLILKHPYSRLLFTYRLIRVNSRSITCHDFIEAQRLYYWSISCDQSTRAFFNDWQIMWDPMEQIFFTIKCSCNIECMLVALMPKVVSI